VYKLIIEDDEGRTTVVPFQRDEITIGRKEGNTIRLTERNVSRHHARFGRSNASIFVEDLDSYNGVKVNGDRITARTTLREGDLVEIGDYHLALQKVEEELAAAPAGPPSIPASTAPALRAAAKAGAPAPTTADGGTAVLRLPLEEKPTAEPSRARPLASGEVARLVVQTTELAGQIFSLDRSEMTIGRTEDNDIVVPHRSISSRHAKIVHDAGQFRIVDLDSANGVLVNGEEYARVDIRKGDVIELGHVKFQFLAPGDQAQAGALTAPAAPVRSLVDASAAESRAGKKGLGMKIGLGLGAVAVLGLGTFLALHFMAEEAGGEASKDAGGAAAGADAAVGAEKGGAVPAEQPRAADKFQEGLNIMKTGDWRAARAAFQATLAIEADHKGAVAMLEKVNAEQQGAELLAKAKAAIEERDWDLAFESLNEVAEGIQAAPEAGKLKPEVQRKWVFMHINQADLLMNGGKKDQLQDAMKHLETVLVVEPGNFTAKDKLKKARAKLASASGVRPPAGRDGGEDRPPAADSSSKRKRAKELADKATAAYKKKQYREAQTALQEALKLTPTNYELHRQLGACHAMEGEMGKAYVHYRKYVQLCPTCMYVPQVRKIIQQYEDSQK